MLAHPAQEIRARSYRSTAQLPKEPRAVLERRAIHDKPGRRTTHTGADGALGSPLYWTRGRRYRWGIGSRGTHFAWV